MFSARRLASTKRVKGDFLIRFLKIEFTIYEVSKEGFETTVCKRLFLRQKYYTFKIDRFPKDNMNTFFNEFTNSNISSYGNLRL